MSNQNQQPQGISQSFDTTKIPEHGFIRLEQNHKKQITLANHIILTGTANNAKLVLNDALLRNKDDKILLEFAGGTATLYLLKKPIQQADELTDDNVLVQYSLSEQGSYELTKSHNRYHFVKLSAITPIQSNTES